MAVFVWGANSHGQLGLGNESEMYTTPQQLMKPGFAPSSVRCIRGGGGHVLILDACGRIYACGWNNRGQLGIDSTRECCNEFKIIPANYFEDEPIDIIACGWDVSGGITSNRKLYVWGSNSFQQLGVCRRGFTAIRKPMQLKLPHNSSAINLSFGMRHCAVLTNDGKIYVYGRIKISDHLVDDVSVIKISQSSLIIKLNARLSEQYCFQNVVSGQNHLLIHLKAYRDDGKSLNKLIAVGDNKYGQANSFESDDEFVKYAAGWTHNLVMLQGGQIVSWGRNSYGQLGIGTFSDNLTEPRNVQLPTALKAVDIHVGSEHGLLITQDGDVFTWGWNEHGNCGNDSTHNISKPTLVDLPTSCKIAGCGAGFCIAICQEPTTN